jgi:hypothetical protein
MLERTVSITDEVLEQITFVLDIPLYMISWHGQGQLIYLAKQDIWYLAEDEKPVHVTSL